MQDEVYDLMFELRYRRDFHLSAVEYRNEPADAIDFMQMIYQHEDARAKLEADMNSNNSTE